MNSAKALVDFDAEAEWLNFCHDGVLVVFNFRNQAQRVPMPGGAWELVLRSDAAEASSGSMPAQSTSIYVVIRLHRLEKNTLNIGSAREDPIWTEVDHDKQ